MSLLQRIYRKLAYKVSTSLQYITIQSEARKKVDIQQGDYFVVLDTQMDTNNLGDQIIMVYAQKVLDELLEGKQVIRISTHKTATEEDIQLMTEAKAAIVAGTNFLSPRMLLHSVWKFDPRMIHMTNILMMAVGWSGNKNSDLYSRFVHRTLLKNRFMHSTRDSHAYNLLMEEGISNIINTNCVTLWDMDGIFQQIPHKKANSVVTTVTGYRNCKAEDRYMLELLLELYDKVYFWPQGDTDLEYLSSFFDVSKLITIDETLEAYNKVLEQDDLDYVGTRLHGGIHAMHYKKRTIIIAVDNRAVDIHEDTNLPVIKVSEVESKLRDKILSKWDTNLILNEDAVAKWKEKARSDIESSI